MSQIPGTSSPNVEFRIPKYKKRKRHGTQQNQSQEIKTSNQYQSLSEDDSNDSAGSNTSTDTAFINKNKSTIPPIVHHGYLQHDTTMKQFDNLLGGNLYLKFKGNRTLIFTNKIEDYTLITEAFIKQKIPFHTYTPEAKKPLKLILKNISPSVPCTSIEEDLKQRGINVLGVVQMYKQESPNVPKQLFPMFKVTFAADTKIPEVVKTQYICKYRITWEKIKNDNRVTQCYKCQNFGHIATNCNLGLVCVFCAGDHGKNECPEINTEKRKCNNCKGDHPAKTKSCAVFAKQLEIKINQNQRNNTRYNQPAFRPRRNDFPNLVPNNARLSQANPWFIRADTPQLETETFSSMWKEIKQIFNSFNLSNIIKNIKEFIQKFRQAPDNISKILMTGEFFLSFLDNNE